MSAQQSSPNRFLAAPPGRVFAATALPMVAIMLMNGLLGIVDAAFLGHFVGPDAMAAVGIAFPVLMLIIALSTLVSGGMSSLYARQIGAGDRAAAGATFARAHGLALAISICLMVAFALLGWRFAIASSGSTGPVAHMAWTFLAISVAGTPVQFLLGIHADSLRNEGRVGTMALMSLGVTVINIVLNYVAIAQLGLGVAGSAASSLIAQIVGLALLAGLRLRSSDVLPLSALRDNRWTGGWKAIATLGAPVSLGFIGMAFTAAIVVAAIRLTQTDNIEATLAAYGIATRVLAFVYLPLMAIALAMQSVVGNNVGAGLFARSNAVLRIAAITAFVYGAVIQLLLTTQGVAIGSAFVDAPAVIGETAHVLRLMAGAWALSGPVLVLGLYFQAIGQPARAAVLTISKPFILQPALIVLLAIVGGAGALWFAYPLADVVATLIALTVLVAAIKRTVPEGGLGISPAPAAP
ncbi:MAG: MATE family efflux transporter [Mesorhizobium sp.]